MAKLVVIIQCDIVQKKCVGYACMKSFYERRDVVVHLASCVVSDNYHRPPCPHRDYIKTIVERKGYPVIFGSYISKTAEKKRQDGIYEAF